MDKLISWIFLAVLINAGIGQEQPPLEVKLSDTTTRYLNVGDEADFTCNVNRDMAFMLGNDVNWNLYQDWSDKNYYLVDKIALQEDAQPEYYEANYAKKEDNDKDYMHFHIKFKNIRPRDDGRLVCEAQGVLSEVQIVVLQPVTTVSLQLDDLPAVTTDVAEPEMINSGQHKVTCKAMGSNPAVENVEILIGGVKVAAPEPVILQADGELRTYTTTVTVQPKMRYKDHDGEDIQCVAVDSQNNKLSVKMPVKIRTPNPNITCDSHETWAGKQMVSLKCIVDHKDIAIDGFKYKIVQGNKEYLVVAKEGVSQKINGKSVQARTKDLVSGSKTQVVLQLQEIQDQYFTGSTHLVVESSGGHLTEGKALTLKKMQAPSNHTKKKGPKSGSPQMAASLVTVLLVSLLAWRL